MDNDKRKERLISKEIDSMLAPWKNSVPRDPERIEKVLSLVSTFWKKNPDLRLGQIIENIASRSNSHAFYMEDSIVIDWIKKDLKIE